MLIALYKRNIEPQSEVCLRRLQQLLAGYHIETVTVDGARLPGAPIDFVLSIGGDGTLLSAAHLVGDRRIPVVGVNFGHLGFLTTAGKEDLDSLVSDLVSGHYTIEERTLLQAEYTVPADGAAQQGRFSLQALNEVSLHRVERLSLLHTDLYVDGRFVSTYAADGLIVATPTGSTAYSLSCGGPILTPDSGCFVITPIAAHSLTLRPIIVPDTAHIVLEPRRSDAPVCLSYDSAAVVINGDAKISLRRAAHTVPLVRLSNHNFFTALHEKLSL